MSQAQDLDRALRWIAKVSGWMDALYWKAVLSEKANLWRKEATEILEAADMKPKRRRKR